MDPMGFGNFPWRMRNDIGCSVSYFKVNPFWWDDCEIIDLHDVTDIGYIYIGEMWLIWLMIADSFAFNIRILLPSGDPELQRRFACG